MGVSGGMFWEENAKCEKTKEEIGQNKCRKGVKIVRSWMCRTDFICSLSFFLIHGTSFENSETLYEIILCPVCNSKAKNDEFTFLSLTFI
jgi:hypothetical protein